MNLDDILVEPLNHSFYYQETQQSYSLKDILKCTPQAQYVVDNCVLRNSTHVLKEIKNYLLFNKGYLENISKLIKCTYGQVKALNSLAKKNKLIISQEILEEYLTGENIFLNSFSQLQNVLEKSDYIDEEFHKYQEKLLDEVSKLTQILPYCVFNGNVLIVNDILNEFKQSNFFQESFSVKRRVNGVLQHIPKQISKTDLFLLGIAVYEQNKLNSTYQNTEVLSNDSDLLAQGRFVYKNRVLASPDILSSEINFPFSREFQFSFHRHEHPYLSEDQIN
jgi:hypothetical protein